MEYLKEEDMRKLLVEEHEEIYQSVCRRDVQRAQEISLSHLENQRKAIIHTIRTENAGIQEVNEKADK